MISVCMTTCNSQRFLQRQIDSILSQLSPTDELIISDDSSTDSTLQIISSYSDGRIKLFHHKPEPKGRILHYVVSENFENALIHASGDYVFLADHDDIWAPDKILTTLPWLEKGFIVQSNFSLIDFGDNVKLIRSLREDPFSSSFVMNLLRHPFHGCCLAFPSSVLKVALPFPKNTIMHDSWIGVTAQSYGYKIKFLDEPLVLYRRHSANVSFSKSKNPLWFKIAYRIKFLKDVIVRRLSVKH